jgi:hypothetical protein
MANKLADCELLSGRAQQREAHSTAKVVGWQLTLVRDQYWIAIGVLVPRVPAGAEQRTEVLALPGFEDARDVGIGVLVESVQVEPTVEPDVVDARWAES